MMKSYPGLRDFLTRYSGKRNSVLLVPACALGRSAGLALLISMCVARGAGTTTNDTTAVIETSLGRIVVTLESAKAPKTVANFLRYAAKRLYDGGAFYRTVRDGNQSQDSIRIAVIQGGMNESRRGEQFEPIALERTQQTGLRHFAGTISMARDTPDSAADEFFICVRNEPELDYGGKRNPDGQGFAAFGKVTSGMEGVRRINEAPAAGQRLTPPIQIISVAVRGQRTVN